MPRCDGADADTIADGRDLGPDLGPGRLAAQLRRPGGIEATVLGEAQADAYHISRGCLSPAP
jgi:hypothetical protein